MNKGIINKGFLGKGGYKNVWDLKPLQVHSDCPEMVRARFHWNCSGSGTLQERLQAIQKFKNEIDPKYLLIPDTVMCTNSSNKTAIYQMMPKAQGSDLIKAFKKDRISYLGKLHIIRNLALGLMEMHKHKWVHLDVKPENIFIMDQDRDHPISKLGDLDLSRKIHEGKYPPYRMAYTEFTDPKCVKGMAAGLEDAKIHDQFSFGITVCEILTENLPRYNYNWSKLRAWVTEGDLTAVSGYSELNKDLQNIISSCCVGSQEVRPYRLPDFVATLEKVIDEFITNHNAKPGVEYVFSHSVYECQGIL